ncbi:MAG: DNA/RNA non-specific endonuclease [Bacteroidia bacterium]
MGSRTGWGMVTLVVILIAVAALLQEKTIRTDSPATPLPTSIPQGAKNSTLKFSAQATRPCQIVEHTHYKLCYDEEHEQALWTAYLIEGKNLKKSTVRRTNDFREDPKIPTRSARLENYKNSGYDKGHLVPAGDFKWTEQGMSETFYMSNISPQLHDFNAGIWETLERHVRHWAQKNDRLYVFTGPVFSPRDKKIGPEKVTVPTAFYKAIYDLDEPEKKSIAFLVPHKPTQRPIRDFAISIDSLEKVTGIDFFPELEDKSENTLEAQCAPKAWPLLPPGQSPYKKKR